MAKKGEEVVRCSFCGKAQAQVRKLIAGPNGAYICDECVEICTEIIEEEFEFGEPVENMVYSEKTKEREQEVFLFD